MQINFKRKMLHCNTKTRHRKNRLQPLELERNDPSPDNRATDPVWTWDRLLVKTMTSLSTRRTASWPSHAG
jgi:hypothetical protein